MQLTNIDFDTRDHLLSQRGAQLALLREIKNCAPEVLEDLARGPFHLYQSIREEPVEYHRRLRGEGLTAQEHHLANAHAYVTSAIWRDMNEGKAGDFLPLLKALGDWSQRWNLDADWCRALAFFTLATWLMDPIKGSERDWNYVGMDWSIPVDVEDFKFEWAWHPLRTPRSEIERVMRSRFETEMKEYLDKTEKQFVATTGAVRPLKKTQQGHFGWLVAYQIKGVSQSSISKRVNATRQTVADGIKFTAELCDLKLRPRNAAGRPRATSKRTSRSSQ